MVHALTAAVELDPGTTVLSVDGVGAFDTVSRKAIQAVPGASRCLPFVRQFYASPFLASSELLLVFLDEYVIARPDSIRSRGSTTPAATTLGGLRWSTAAAPVLALRMFAPDAT